MVNHNYIIMRLFELLFSLMLEVFRQKVYLCMILGSHLIIVILFLILGKDDGEEASSASLKPVAEALSGCFDKSDDVTEDPSLQYHG